MAAKSEYHKFPRSRTELLRQLEEWVEDREGLYAEYERLQEFTKENVSGDISEKDENRRKNRYKDILPYEWRRVKIPDEDAKPGEEQNKYINASWILFKGTKQKYIASQAPLEDTISEFWQCVAHHGVQVIVMLTDLHEGTKAKSTQYWPDKGKVIYSDTEVILEEEEEKEHFRIRRLGLVQGDINRGVTHIQVKGWGDYSVPDTPDTLISLLSEVRSLSKSFAPILVHCSAGVGRTGTFIATDRLIDSLQETVIFYNRPCVWDSVVEMRRARPKMVQKKEQYAYIYECLLTYMKGSSLVRLQSVDR